MRACRIGSKICCTWALTAMCCMTGIFHQADYVSFYIADLDELTRNLKYLLTCTSDSQQAVEEKTFFTTASVWDWFQQRLACKRLYPGKESAPTAEWMFIWVWRYWTTQSSTGKTDYFTRACWILTWDFSLSLVLCWAQDHICESQSVSLEMNMSDIRWSGQHVKRENPIWPCSWTEVAR